jgi:hypothetical protein
MFTSEEISEASEFFPSHAAFFAADGTKKRRKKAAGAGALYRGAETSPASPAEAETADGLRERLRTVVVDGETFYVAEGDLLLDEDELEVYAVHRQARRLNRLIASVDTVGQRTELLGIKSDGRLVRWQPGLVLTYCVLKQSFTQQSEYELVRENMRRATEEWENTCGIQFEHRADLDGSNITPRPDGVVFVVRQLDAGGRYIAAAFFPNDPPARRRVLIDPSYFTTSFDKVGVLRHELGHVLGFRHEHIRSGAPPNCPQESTAGTIDLTKYDPRSVMHYFCGDVGSRELGISETDVVGAQKVYGPPADAFRFVA